MKKILQFFENFEIIIKMSDILFFIFCNQKTKKIPYFLSPKSFFNS